MKSKLKIGEKIICTHDFRTADGSIWKVGEVFTVFNITPLLQSVTLYGGTLKFVVSVGKDVIRDFFITLKEQRKLKIEKISSGRYSESIN